MQKERKRIVATIQQQRRNFTHVNEMDDNTILVRWKDDMLPPQYEYLGVNGKWSDCTTAMIAFWRHDEGKAIYMNPRDY